MSEQEKNKRLTEFFGQSISENKKVLMEQVLENRTRYVTLVLEDIYQSQNASAAVRTCECMGLQEVHFIENSTKYSTNKKVLKGSDKWIDIIRHNKRNVNNTEESFRVLREAGYKVYVMDPSPDGVSIDELSIENKIALVMGNELNGISKYAFDHADGKVKIPMYGFTESLNISVSAAIGLNTLIPKIRKSSISWNFTNDEKDHTRLQWYRKCVRNAELQEREFMRSIG